MPRPKIVFKYTELLQPLTKEQLENLFKFMGHNGELLVGLRDHEGCCFSDDYDILWSYAKDAARIGYGYQDLDEYIKNEVYDCDDEEDEDE